MLIWVRLSPPEVKPGYWKESLPEKYRHNQKKWSCDYSTKRCRAQKDRSGSKKITKLVKLAYVKR